MFHKLHTLFAIGLMLWFSPARSAEIGFRQTIIDEAGNRPLEVSIWYPTRVTSPVAQIGENIAFYGIKAIRDAVPTPTRHPAILLSHGYGGNWRNLSWLAASLAHQGYIVAAPNHPGTTSTNRDPAQASMLWERPHDISRTLGALIADPALAGPVATGKIAAIGHSLGGWTVAALAGGRFDPDQFIADCKEHARLRACILQNEFALSNPAIRQDMRDPRIKAFVSLDLGLARSFTAKSLSAINIPSLVIAAGTDVGDMPAKLESGYLWNNLSWEKAQYSEIGDAMHFSFMQRCKPNAAALLEEENPGDSIICKDGGQRSRQKIHKQVSAQILHFLGSVLPAY